MTYNYYNPKDDSTSEFSFGDIKLNLQSKKERIPGIFIRKISATKDGGASLACEHLQETNWDDNHSPDFGEESKVANWFTRMTFILNNIKKLR